MSNNLTNKDIKEVTLEEIDSEMPFYEFIGKTIEKLMYTPGYIDIQFTDGTFGIICLCKSCSSSKEHMKWVKSIGKTSAYITGGVLPSTFYD